MSVHIQSVDMDVWDAMDNVQFQPQVVANGLAQDKSKVDWSDDDKKKVQYDLCWNKMCLTIPLLSFDDNKVLKIVNWIC